MKPLRIAMVALLTVSALMPGCAPQQKQRPRHLAARRLPPPPVAEPSSYVPWGEHTVGTRLDEFGARSRRRWAPYFRSAAVTYPAASVVLVAFKREKRMEVYAGVSPYQLALVRSIDIVAASGGPGPKLREGDRQVPEGVYSVESLNPNSLYHVGLRLAYPNDFDQRMGQRDHRRNLGGNIVIHGSDRSIGCLAVGDQAAEDLFVLSADAGLDHVSVVIVPRDFRRTGEAEPLPGQPSWVRDLYADLDRRLEALPESRPVAARRGAAGAGRSVSSR